MYGLGYSIKSFAVANEFTATTNKICFKLGKNLQPFSLLGNILQEEHGVVDLVQFGGLRNPDVTLLDDIIAYRQDNFNLSPIPIKDMDYDMKKTFLFDFLMSTSLCYVEVAKTKISQGIEVPTYDKFLCTRNPAIMGAWMGLSPEEMQGKYSNRIRFDNAEFMRNTIRYVKLNQTAKGNTVTCPRNFYDTTNMCCVPLFMIYAWVSGLRTVIMDKLVKISFIKDNGSVREMFTTLSEDIIRSFYSNNEFVGKMLSNIDLDKSQQGGMYLPSRIGRGYMHIPEIGSSMYDTSGVRAVNVTRILEVSIAENRDIDTSYINVSLDSVKGSFMQHLDRIVQENPTLLYKIYSGLTTLEVDTSVNVIEVRVALEKWVNTQDMLFSTQFKKDLHTFMLSHDEWFKDYTGIPQFVNPVATGCGVADYEF